MKSRLVWLIILLMLPFAAEAQDDPLRVTASTTIIADVARNVGGDLVTVTALVPRDADVHAFQPAPSDAEVLGDAAVVLVNGAGLETFLDDMIENVAGVEPVVVSEGVEILAFGDEDDEVLGTLGDDLICEGDEGHDAHDYGNCDPHVWTDPHNVMRWADVIAEAFATADPDHAETYRENAAAYRDDLEALDEDIRELVETIPEANRLLVTNHDILSYFARAYGFEIAGVVLGSSTLDEPTPRELGDLIDRIEAADPRALFIEIGANTRMIDLVAAETGIDNIVTVYGGALSETDGPAPTYMAYMRYNTQVIVDALKP